MSQREVMTANQALARGALEAGVRVATSYPGEPVSAALHYLGEVAEEHNIRVEWSVNEKVAYEVALGASFQGLRAVVFVKHVGFNWILDPFAGSAFTGVGGGLVVVVGDDPGGKGSTSEEDSRYLAELAEVPLLEPATLQEAKDMVAYAFDLSERVELPVVVRVVTRLCRQRGPVRLGPVREGARLELAPRRWVVKESLYHHHEELGRKNRLLEELSEASSLNQAEVNQEAELGIIGCGSVLQLVDRLPDPLRARVSTLRVGFVRPLPRRMVEDFAKKHSRLLVVEEVQPFLERAVRATLAGRGVEVYGKLTGHLPWSGELEAERLLTTVGGLLGLDGQELKPLASPYEEGEVEPSNYPIHPCPREFDPRCPHRFTLQALRSALKRVGGPWFVTGDVGCMSLDFRTEAPILESMIAMGSSVAVAAGVKAADPDRYVVAVVGDSSFYHNGLQGLIDAAYHQTPIVVLILDNEITAQSGFQPDPGTGPSGEPGSGGRRIPLEGVVSALGVEVKVVDAFQPEEVEEALVEALESQECRVVISRGLCPLAEQAGAYPPQK